jgi:hypothetical protein
VEASNLSYPAIACSTAAISQALLAIGPTWSIDGANSCTPYLLTLPYVGLMPKQPQSEDGTRIEPLVSVPIEAGVFQHSQLQQILH